MQLEQITPFVPCSDLDRQIVFYRDRLGFSPGYRSDGYAFMRRDKVALRLVQVFDHVDLQHPERQGSFYIDVQGIEDLYRSLEPALATLPTNRLRVPFDQPYGQREFHVADEDCTLIMFGEPIAQAA
ncbi:MAG: VOC family protein [Neomegalonema sp.]|nr:VOC family protein [Neomegalonema sp.]